MSNLTFVSKIIEKVLDTRLEQHLRENNLHEPAQSAYRKQHSSEMTLIKIQSDILQALDNGGVAALVLLDLSAVFHTIDHSIFIKHLEHTHGISGDALWMAFYLREGNQQVIASANVLLEYGVPQGSVLGPKLYMLYTEVVCLNNCIKDVHIWLTKKHAQI